MQTRLITIGNELALILDRSLVDSLQFGRDQALEIEVHGDSLVVHRAIVAEPDPIGEAFRQIVDHPDELETGKHYHAIRPN